MDVFFAFFIYFVITSLLSSFLIFLCVNCCIKFFNIKNFRLSVLLRYLPIFILPIHFAWSIIHHFYFETWHPWGCKVTFFCSFKRYLIASPYSSAFALLSFIFISYSLFSFFYLLFNYFKNNLFLYKINKNSKKINLQKTNDIHLKLKKENIQLLQSTDFSSPCILFNRYIIIPSSLLPNISLEELKAIIAHETAHARWKDSYLLALCRSISAFFWWIPLKKWIEQIEQEQEYACDQAVLLKQIDPSDLMRALTKSARSAKGSLTNHLCFVSSLTKPSKLGQRIAQIISYPQNQKRSKTTQALSCCLISIAFILLIQTC